MQQYYPLDFRSSKGGSVFKTKEITTINCRKSKIVRVNKQYLYLNIRSCIIANVYNDLKFNCFANDFKNAIRSFIVIELHYFINIYKVVFCLLFCDSCHPFMEHLDCFDRAC